MSLTGVIPNNKTVKRTFVIKQTVGLLYRYLFNMREDTVDARDEGTSRDSRLWVFLVFRLNVQSFKQVGCL